MHNCKYHCQDQNDVGDVIFCTSMRNPGPMYGSTFFFRKIFISNLYCTELIRCYIFSYLSNCQSFDCKTPRPNDRRAFYRLSKLLVLCDWWSEVTEAPSVTCLDQLQPNGEHLKNSYADCYSDHTMTLSKKCVTQKWRVILPLGIVWTGSMNPNDLTRICVCRTQTFNYYTSVVMNLMKNFMQG